MKSNCRIMKGLDKRSISAEMDNRMKEIIDNLPSLENKDEKDRDDLVFLLENILLPQYREFREYLFEEARALTFRIFSNNVYVRGLIEFSSFCRNNCTYCGIRRDNNDTTRFRLTKEEILSVCESGYKLGFRTFVLQGGEDPFFHNERLLEIISAVKERFPDCALTLSVGERDFDVYRQWRKAGVDRFLLRHETINRYSDYHPDMALGRRLECLASLKKLKYQVGSGFLVGLPTTEISDYADDLLFLNVLKPEMVGIGPFIAHKDTPLAESPNGTVEMTKVILAVIRLMLPSVLLPTTTALNTLAPRGLLDGLTVGANVVMFSLTPEDVRDYYSLYEGKSRIDIATEGELDRLSLDLEAMGLCFNMQRGDYVKCI